MGVRYQSPSETRLAATERLGAESWIGSKAPMGKAEDKGQNQDNIGGGTSPSPRISRRPREQRKTRCCTILQHTSSRFLTLTTIPGNTNRLPNFIHKSVTPSRHRQQLLSHQRQIISNTFSMGIPMTPSKLHILSPSHWHANCLPSLRIVNMTTKGGVKR